MKTLFKIFVLSLCLVTLVVAAQGISVGARFSIEPQQPLPTEVTESQTAIALYTITNTSGADLNEAYSAMFLPSYTTAIADTDGVTYSPSLCGLTFTLKEGESCTLKLAITGTAVGGFKICNGTSYKCTQNNTYPLAVQQVANGSASLALPAPKIILPNHDFPVSFLMQNNSAATANNVNIDLSSLGINVSLVSRSNNCDSLPAGDACTITVSSNGINYAPIPTVPIQGANTNLVNLAVTTFDTASLFGVSCANNGVCNAVGDYFDLGLSFSYQTLVLHSNNSGLSWSVVASPNQSGAILNGVSCVDESHCIAVGNFNSTHAQTFILKSSDGGNSWSQANSANHLGTDNLLTAVSCADANNCFAVGSYLNAGLHQTLILQSSDGGDSWSVVDAPNKPTPGTDNLLYGISCISNTNCNAVGTYFDTGLTANQSLVLHWDGTSWAIATSANQPTANNLLNSVSCVDTNNCYAVGFFHGGVNAETLILHSSDAGMTWTIVPATPNPGSMGNNLNSVSCVDANNCTAVGSYVNDGSNTFTMILRLANGTWAQVAAPSISPVSNGLAGVSCIGPLECMAVGNYEDANLKRQALILGNAGMGWVTVPGPLP